MHKNCRKKQLADLSNFNVLPDHSVGLSGQIHLMRSELKSAINKRNCDGNYDISSSLLYFCQFKKENNGTQLPISLKNHSLNWLSLASLLGICCRDFSTLRNKWVEIHEFLHAFVYSEIHSVESKGIAWQPGSKNISIGL